MTRLISKKSLQNEFKVPYHLDASRTVSNGVLKMDPLQFYIYTKMCESNAHAKLLLASIAAEAARYYFTKSKINDNSLDNKKQDIKIEIVLNRKAFKKYGKRKSKI